MWAEGAGARTRGLWRCLRAEATWPGEEREIDGTLQLGRRDDDVIEHVLVNEALGLRRGVPQNGQQ